jgi:hypothetical protein
MKQNPYRNVKTRREIKEKIKDLQKELKENMKLVNNKKTNKMRLVGLMIRLAQLPGEIDMLKWAISETKKVKK